MIKYYSFDANVHLKELYREGHSADSPNEEAVVACVRWDDDQAMKVVKFLVNFESEADMEDFKRKHSDLYHDMYNAAKMEFTDMMAKYSPDEEYKIQSIDLTFPDEIFFEAEQIIAERETAEANYDEEDEEM